MLPPHGLLFSTGDVRPNRLGERSRHAELSGWSYCQRHVASITCFW